MRLRYCRCLRRQVVIALLSLLLDRCVGYIWGGFDVGWKYVCEIVAVCWT